MKETKEILFGKLDLNTTARGAEDGTLQKAHNIRYGRNGIEAIFGFDERCKLNPDSPYTIIYEHNERLLAFHSDNSLHHIEIDDEGTITSLQRIEGAVATADIKFSHFSSVLFATNTDGQKSYIWNNETYSKFNPSDLTPLDNPTITYDYTNIATLTNSSYLIGCNNDETEFERPYIPAIQAIRNEGYIYGAFYLIIAYKLYDGTIVKNSPLIQIESSGQEESETGTMFYEHNSTESNVNCEHSYHCNLTGCKPTLSFQVDSNLLSNEMVSSIAIFSTRVVDIYDIENIHKNYQESSYTINNGISMQRGSLFFTKELENLATEPFYEVTEINLSQLNGTHATIELNYNDHFKNIYYNKLFTASFSVHNTIHQNMIEYNGRLHTFGHQIELYPGLGVIKESATLRNSTHLYSRNSLPANYHIEISFTLEIMGSEREIKSNSYHYYYTRNNSNGWFIPVNHLYSYPDIRCHTMNIWLIHGGKRRVLCSFNLKSAAANNLAYYQNIEGDKFSSFKMMQIPMESEIECYTPLNSSNNRSYSDTNVIMVSNRHNPFFFDPINNYSIDSNLCEIYHITTAVDQLTENSFGRYPLIVFTSGGIFALEGGKDEVLYSTISLLDNSPQMKSISSVSHRGIIFFSSPEGLMTITGRTIAPISKEIEVNRDNNASADTLASISEFISNSSLHALIYYNEILLINNNYTYGYVYSLDFKAWSSRDISLRQISSNLFIENNNAIISINIAEDKNKIHLPHIVTNPIKFSVLNLKKIEWLDIHHTITSCSCLQTTLWGSNNLTSWHAVGNSMFGLKIGRTTASWRYFKIEIKASTPLEEQFFFYIWTAQFRYQTKYINVVN